MFPHCYEFFYYLCTKSPLTISKRIFSEWFVIFLFLEQGKRVIRIDKSNQKKDYRGVKLEWWFKTIKCNYNRF